MKITISSIEGINCKVKENDIVIVSKKYRDGLIISGLNNLKCENNCFNLCKDCFIKIPEDYEILDYKNIDKSKKILLKDKIKIIENINSDNNRINIHEVFYQYASFFDEHKLYIGRSRVCIYINSDNLKVHCKNIW